MHTAGEGGSLVQLTFRQKTAGELACERSKAIDRYALAGTPCFVPKRDKKVTQYSESFDDIQIPLF